MFFHNKKMSLKQLSYDDFKRAKAIIFNLAGLLGEKRNNISQKEKFRWIIELTSGNCLTIILISLPRSILILQLDHIKISLLGILIFSFIITSINYKFLKYSLHKGGIRMLINHFLLRVFEMTIATTGIMVSFFDLILLWLKNIKNTTKK